ncbi:MAG: hypothetical protein ACREDF_00025 [Thermoplasmata archaeon]
MMKKTPWKEFTENGQKYRIQATYGMDYELAHRNNQAPYFSLTMTRDRWTGRRWEDEGGGAAHEEIIRHFPTLEPYVKWHLVSTESPMHYLANAKYWYEIATGKLAPGEHQRIDPWDALRSTIVFGGLPTDADHNLNIPWPHLSGWLQERLPLLMETFRHAMKTLGVLE